MASSVIGALRVVLGADTASFESGLKKASSEASKFSASFAKVATIGAAAFAGLAAGVGVAVKGMIDEADKLSKASQKIGVPIEDLHALKIAADLADVSFEALSKGLVKLSKNMADAALKPTGDAADAFKALAIDVKNADGTLKNSSQVLEEVSVAFAGAKDGAAKTAIAIKLFGKAGADLIPLLNEGKEGIAKTREEMQRLGLVLDNQTGKSAQEFNDNLRRLGYAKDAIILKITKGMLPSLEDLSVSLVKASQDSKGLETLGSVIGGSLQVLATIVVTTGATFKQFALDALLVADVAKQLKGGSVQGAIDTFKNWQAESKALAAETDKTIASLWGYGNALAKLTPLTIESIRGAVGLGKAQKELSYGVSEGAKAFEDYIKGAEKQIAVQQIEIATFGKIAGVKERELFIAEGLRVAKEKGLVLSEKEIATLTRLGAQLGTNTLAMEGQRVVADNLTPWENLNKEHEKLNALLAAGKINAEQHGNAMAKAAEKVGLSWHQQSASVAGSLSEIATTFGQENSKIAAAAKVFGAVQALISTYAGAAEALKLPFPFNIAASAAVLAKGLALVSAIKGFAVPSMAGGGSFMVPGGSSGVDNKFVPLNLASGEMVSVTPSSQSGRSGGRTTEITLRARKWTDMMTLGDMRDLVDALNSANRDGYKLKFAT